jgi:hypothetical protein
LEGKKVVALGHKAQRRPHSSWRASDDSRFIVLTSIVKKCIREENLLQMVLWKMVHFALFLVKISINFSPGYSTVFFPSQCTSLLYKNFKILLQKFQNFCTMF